MSIILDKIFIQFVNRWISSEILQYSQFHANAAVPSFDSAELGQKFI